MTIQLYLDLGCTFLLQVVEHTSCCGKSIYRSKDKQISDEQEKQYQLKWQTLILYIRTTFGLTSNIASFIAV